MNNRILVVYYSLEGNTQIIAETIADETSGTLLALKPEKEIGTGFTKYLWGGSQVFMKKKPPLKPLEADPADFDMLFIGTPVWAWTYAPPLASFFHQASFQHKRTALFCCHGGQKGKTLNHMRKQLTGNQVLGEIDFFDPLKKETKSSVQLARRWAADIVKKAMESTDRITNE